MKRVLRLSSSLQVVPSADGPLLLADHSCIALRGGDATWFVEAIMPLLDGSRAAEDVADAMRSELRDDVLNLLEALTARGILHEEVHGASPSCDRGSTPVAAPVVLIVGQEAWAGVVGDALEREGTAHVRAVADSRAAAEHDWDVLVAALAHDDLGELARVARHAHQRRRPSVTAYVAGSQLVLGPVVLPGRTACWNCARLRQLAHASKPPVAHAMQTLLLTKRRNRRPAPLSVLDRLLGHLLSFETPRILAQARQSPLAGRLMVLETERLRLTLHDVVPLPWCEVCGGAAAHRQESGWADRSTGAGWIDDRTGVLASVSIAIPTAGEEGLPVTATAVPPSYADDEHAPRRAPICSGKGFSCGEALMGALGEALERYSAARHRTRDLHHAAFDEIEGDALDPRALCLYVDEQYEQPGFPYARFSPKQPIHWTAGRWLDTGTPVWVPALPTYLWLDVPLAERFCQVTSSGLAAATTFGEASLRALFEVVERDALLMTWFARRAPVRLLNATRRDAECSCLVRALHACGAEVELYLLDVGLPIPTVLCLALGDGTRWPGATVTAAARANPWAAVRAALLEQGQVGPALRRLVADRRVAIPPTAADVLDMAGHALFYVPPERRPAFDFLRDGAASTLDLDDLEDPGDVGLERCVESLAAHSIRMAVVDVTSPDVATTPFRVARAVGTWMQPLHFGFGRERRDSPRLTSALNAGLNPDPHPLP